VLSPKREKSFKEALNGADYMNPGKMPPGRFPEPLKSVVEVKKEHVDETLYFSTT